MRTALTLSDLDYRFLATTPLFARIAEQDIQSKLVALGAVIRSYPKGAFIHLEGDRVHTMSLVLRGRVHIEHDDVWGNRALSYLSFLATKTQSRRFTIPFDRQQMADYLGVDRSALSAELSKMQKEGLLRYRKSDFFLTGAKLLDE